jgi:hypothetical protein
MELSEQPLANETLHFRTTTFCAQLLLGGGGVTVWGCFSFDCKLDLYVLDGNLTGQAPTVLNGLCRARLDMSRSSLGIVCEVYLHVDGQ